MNIHQCDNNYKNDRKHVFDVYVDILVWSLSDLSHSPAATEATVPEWSTLVCDDSTVARLVVALEHRRLALRTFPTWTVTRAAGVSSCLV